MSFAPLRLHLSLLEHLVRLGYERPSPIQSQLIPPILDGRDVLAYSEQGTGKCDAVLQTIIHQQYSQPTTSITHVILAPTGQVTDWLNRRLQKLSEGSIQATVIQRNANRKVQEGGPTVIITTPDCLLVCLEQASLQLADMDMLTLVDTGWMTDLDFWTPISQIMAKLPAKCQVIILADSESTQVAEISSELQQTPMMLCPEPSDAVPSSIAQRAWPVPRHLKMQLLLRFMTEFDPGPMLVIFEGHNFGLRIARKMRARNISVGTILDNDRGKRERTTLQRFHSGIYQILVMSGKISPKIQTHKVTHVVNYDFPSDRLAYFAHLQSMPQAMFLNLVAPEDEQRLLEVEHQLGRPMRRDELANFDYSSPPPTSGRKLREGETQRGRYHKTANKTWDPEIPRTWGDRNAPRRKNLSKISLEEWTLGPLPDIWTQEKKQTRASKSRKPHRRKRSNRRSKHSRRRH